MSLNDEMEAELSRIVTEPYNEAKTRYPNPDYASKAFIIHDLEKESNLPELLKRHPFFKDQVNPKMFFSGTGWSRIDVEDMNRKLIHRRITDADSKKCVAMVDKLHETKEAEVIIVSALWGISVETSISLNNKINIMPVKELPDVERKHQLLEKEKGTSTLMSLERTSQLGSIGFDVPTTVLVQQFTIPDIFLDSDKDKYVKEIHEVCGKYDTIKRIASLTLVSPVLEALSWVSFLDDDLDYIQYYGSETYHNYESYPFVLKDQPCNGNDLRQLVSSFEKQIEGINKNKINMALDRFHRAMLRRSACDSIIELSIALEALFSDGNVEMAHKISTRAAILIGGGNEQKAENRMLFKKFYNQRSSIIHGELTNDNDKIQALKGESKISIKDFKDRMLPLCGLAIQKMILLEEAPNWDIIDLGKREEKFPVRQRSSKS